MTTTRQERWTHLVGQLSSKDWKWHRSLVEQAEVKSRNLEIIGLIWNFLFIKFETANFYLNRSLTGNSVCIHIDSPLSEESRVKQREGPDLRSVTLQNSTNSNRRDPKKQRSHLFIVLQGWINSLWATTKLTSQYTCGQNWVTLARPLQSYHIPDMLLLTWTENLGCKLTWSSSEASLHSSSESKDAACCQVSQPLQQGRVLSYRHINSWSEVLRLECN